MPQRKLAMESRSALEQVLGYLNFSSGGPDPQFLARLNFLFAEAERLGAEPAWRVVGDSLRITLSELRESSPTFRDADQAVAVLDLVYGHVLPGYREFHRDLLFHHTEATLFRPFFVGRVFEAVLKQGAPWNETERVTRGAIALLNDFLGHRPVAALESQKIEPYPHEFVRPIPMYIRGAGVSTGPEREVIETALELLEGTDPDLLSAAYFDPALLDELAVDPRAYDFDHPANKRPNYHFGQWDPHLIDNRGNYRRFVVQGVTLDALMQRLSGDPDLTPEEATFEAAAVLAGTVLMASGISGEGPETHDSTTTLASLLPRIARYRDEFYQRLFSKAAGNHAARLRLEAEQKRQPFGGARQHLNAQLARRRASQLEHTHLARIFAQMGHLEAADREANIIPCVSSRMRCQIDCLLVAGQRAANAGRLEDAANHLPQIQSLLMRGIECGAFVDPWNILGFDAQFSLFPAIENSVRDHRVDDLIELMDLIFALHSRVWADAAAADHQELSKKVARQFKELANWWHQFAAHEVSSVEAVDAAGMFRAAERVAQALAVWHQGGAAANKVAFWAEHAEMFDSPKAYALVVDALLKRGDIVASQALLVHWLSQAEIIGLERADSSFPELAQRWFVETTAREPAQETACPWALARKFIDHLEANAESFWKVPQFSLRSGKSANEPLASPGNDDDEEDDFESDAFCQSAYEGMVFRDSTDDGVDGMLFEDEDVTHDDLLRESKRVAERLSFLGTVASLWKQAALVAGRVASRQEGPAHASSDCLTALAHWIDQAEQNQQGLLRLLGEVRDYRITPPASDHHSLMEYDRRRLTKESLLERIVTASVATADAMLWLRSAVVAFGGAGSAPWSPDDEEGRLVCLVCGALLAGDRESVMTHWPELLAALQRRPLLYVPLAKGGQPQEITAVRVRQHALQVMLTWLPRRGMWIETFQLLEQAREMERSHPVGAGAVTEFDELFKMGYKALVESLAASVEEAPQRKQTADDELQLVSLLEQLTESLLASWLAHSRTLRLSVLEKAHEPAGWKKLVAFVERYGGELFTQRFLNLGNIRAILHEGIGAWLKAVEEDPTEELPQQLMDDLAAGQLDRETTVEQLTLILEAIVENYGEYRDYNSTTTQSDRGELLYTLLDFLRLRTRYDRVCWNLKPVVLAHEILVRRRHEGAAAQWRRSLAERIADESEQYLARLAELQKKYAMRMPTVADRLAERFIRPLIIDRIRAFVAPAMEEAEAGGPAPSFELLQAETEILTREPTGVGLDIPAWLAALEEEVDLASRPLHELRRDDQITDAVPLMPIPIEELESQLDAWEKRPK